MLARRGLRICGLILLLVTGGHLSNPPPGAFAADTPRTTRLLVDPSKRVGHLPDLFRAGSYHWYLPDAQTDRAFDKFLAENKVGTIGIMLDTVLEPSRNFQHLSANLAAWNSTAKKVAGRGGEVLFQIWSTPRWLASNPSQEPDRDTFESKTLAFKSPPRDYGEWARIVYAIVDHYNNRLKLDAKYQVWAEPDIHWLGTEEEYLQLYLASVKGARSADPRAKIGGPAVSRWDSRYERIKGPLSDTPAIHNFIRYASQTALPELGLSRLPIDFVVWHGYNLDPFSPRSFALPAQTIRHWLKTFGYDERTELLLGEWNTWQETGTLHPYYSPEHDTEFVAAYIVAALDAMQRAGIDRHVFTTLFEVPFTPGEPEYVGNFGLFTKGKVIKANYNAFRLISLLGSELVETRLDDEFLVSIGTREGNRVALLIANFFPQGPMLGDVLVKRTAPPFPGLRPGLTREAFVRRGITQPVFERLVRGEVSVDALGLPPEMQSDLARVVAYVRRFRVQARDEAWRVKDPIEVQVAFRNLPYQGSLRYQRYLIDASHSNSYAFRSKVEAGLRERSAWAINEWPEVKLTPVEDRRVVLTGDLRIPITLAPYSVTLLLLSE